MDYMKCPSCSSEWKALPQMITSLENCPFCGKALASIKGETINTLESVLKQISSDYGLEPLRNGSQMVGYFTDLAPELKRECRMLKYFVEAGCHTALFNTRDAGPADQQMSMDCAVQKMTDEFLIAEDAARAVCGAYWIAVCGNPVRSVRQPTDNGLLRAVLSEPTVQHIEPKPALAAVSKMPVISEKSVDQPQKPKAEFKIIQRKDYGILRFPDGNRKAFINEASTVLIARFWTNIIAFSAGDSHLIGLRSDGTVRVAGVFLGDKEIQNWSGILALVSGARHTVGLCADGTVKAVGSNLNGQCRTENWFGITSIAAGADHTVGLCVDGTVCAAGDNKYGQCNVRDWSEITAIAAGREFTAGLRRDGTVVVAGSASMSAEVGRWKDMTAITAGDFHIVGLCRNGTVKAVSSVKDLLNNRCNVKKWTNVAAIAADNTITVGLQSDGTILCTNPSFLKRFP